MAWFRKEKKPKEAIEKQTAIPEGLWVKCDDCKEIVYRKEVEQNLSVCPKCGYHFRLDARERFAILFDDNNYKEFATNIKSGDPLEFRDTKKYRDRLKVYQTRVGPGDGAARRCQPAVRLRAHRPHHRRRDRVVRDARRPQYRGAEGADRLCRPT